jgi:hypothetical protein
MAKTNQHKAKTTAELRHFGLVMAAVLGLIGGFLFWKERPAAAWVLGVAGAFLVLGLLLPRSLAPVERGWMALARRLSVVSTFILLTISYFLIITPFALVARIFRRDRLQLKFDPNAASYWVPVEAEGPGTRPHTPY